MNIHIRNPLLLLIIPVLFLTSCIHTKPIPTRTMDFEEGIKSLAVNLAEQLEKSSVGNMLNKIVINPVTKHKQMKKIVIDPFIDVESGYPVKVNSRISSIMSEEISKRFEIAGDLEPDKLEISEFVLNGMVTLAENSEGKEKIYKVYATVFDKTSGKVLGSAISYVSNFDTTPMDIYKDSPVFLKGKDYQQHTASVKMSPNETVNSEYHDRLAIKSMQTKGDKLYEQKEYKKSLSYYNQAAGSQSAPKLEVLNGQFTNLVKQGQWEDAEGVYGKLIRSSIAETSEIATKITFPPKSLTPLGSKSHLYNIYIRQIAKLVESIPECKVIIIGHCSRSGSEMYNEKLSLQRAQWVQKQMASYVQQINTKSETLGKGFSENVVGTGKDNITDEIDRRVEFKFNQCVEK